MSSFIYQQLNKYNYCKKNPQKPIFCNRLQNPPNQNSTIKKSGPGFQARGSSGRTERTLEFVIVGT
jgi:hypothetical protein